MRRLAPALLLALIVIASSATDGGAQGKPKVVFTGGFVYHSEQISPGATVNFKVTCPAGYNAIGGTLSSGDPRVLALSSVAAAGRKAWSFGFRNTDPSATITVVVVVSCVKPPPIFIGKFGVAPSKALKKSVLPGKSATVKALCPSGDVPVGDSEKSLSTGGKRASASSLAGIGGLKITSVVPDAHGVSVGIANPGSSEERVRVAASCVPKKLSAGAKHGSVQIQRSSFNETVKPGGTVVSGACPGSLPLMAGFSIPAGSPVGFVGAGFSDGKFSASWALSNPSQAPGQAKVILVCTPGKVKFVKGAPAASGSIDTQVGPITITH
jgi:hypothetical protein